MSGIIQTMFSGTSGSQPPAGTVYTSPGTLNNVGVYSTFPFGFEANAYQFFEGLTSYITVPGDVSWAFGTSDFTIEWFQFQTDTNSFPRVFSIGAFSLNNVSVACSIENGTFYVWIGKGDGTGQAGRSFGDVGMYKDLWVHFAITRYNGRLRAYKDGVELNPSANYIESTNITVSDRTLYLGNDPASATNTQFLGYQTSFRIVKGMSVYTGPFTTPTGILQLTQTVNPYGGSNTRAIPDGFTKLLLNP